MLGRQHPSRPQMLRIFVTLIIGDVLSNDPKLQDAHKAGAVSPPSGVVARSSLLRDMFSECSRAMRQTSASQVKGLEAVFCADEVRLLEGAAFDGVCFGECW